MIRIALGLTLLMVLTPARLLAQEPVVIRVDANAKLGPFKPIWAYFGYDEPTWAFEFEDQPWFDGFRTLSTNTVWQQMGSPQNPTPEQYARLEAAGQLRCPNSTGS